MCGELRAGDVGTRVRLGGWVHRSRDLGGLTFIDLRDRAGIVQVSCDPRYTPADVCAEASKVGAEAVVLVEGEAPFGAAAEARQHHAALGDGQGPLRQYVQTDVEVHRQVATGKGPSVTVINGDRSYSLSLELVMAYVPTHQRRRHDGLRAALCSKRGRREACFAGTSP